MRLGVLSQGSFYQLCRIKISAGPMPSRGKAFGEEGNGCAYFPPPYSQFIFLEKAWRSLFIKNAEINLSRALQKEKDAALILR